MPETLRLTLKPICLPNKQPKIKLWWPLVTIEGLLTETTTYDVDIYNGPTNFGIHFTNKTKYDTIIQDGKIVDDLAVIIERMEYRGFDFIPYIDVLGKYFIQNGETTGTNGYMGFPGYYNFTINGPLFILARDLAINGQ